MVGALVATACAVLGVVLGSAHPALAATTADPVPVVVVGAPGLAWSDIDGARTPWLSRVAAEGAVASLTVRGPHSRACAVDGWLTLSAGRRAGGPTATCEAPAAPVDGAVPGWGAYVTAARDASYGAVPGTLAQRLADAGRCVEAVGPGAALAAAGEDGRVGAYASDVPATPSCPVLLVDAGTLPADPDARTAALRRLDALVEGVLRSKSPQTRLVVAGVGDGDSPVRPRAVVVSGPPAGVLTSPSTRQPGLVQLQDLTASVLQWSGADATGLTGRVVTAEADDVPGPERVAARDGFEVRAATLREVSPQVTGWLATAFVVWCAAAVGVLLRRRRTGGRTDRAPQWLVAAGTAVASVPVATFVVNVVPWWSTGRPRLAFAGALVAAVVLVTRAALAAGRRHRFGVALVVGVVTLVVLGGDVLAGSRLQLSSVFGQNPTVGGRFYGFGNTSFALYGVAVLTVMAVVGAWAHPRRRVAVGLAALLLLLATALEGHPSYGADFGGPPGLVLGGLLVLAVAAGLRLTVVRVLVAGAAVVVLTLALAVLDWLRPAAARTHLGEFVQTVLDGGADDVVGRKLAQNLTNLGSPPLLAIAAAATVLLVVAWRTGWRVPAPGGVLLRAAVVLGVVGFAVNDSGLVVPAFVLLPLLPVLAAAGRAPDA
ncbi:hypothetical protein [Arthrobacter sp. NEB 688]|uniref:hypothetical protein n=1 Tax=Arthrobacter sp. NEB 688 TaxID=904039 RepID=UPI0015679477|nr:hypothetical protein [Arthrobacter sp. NEB 688]QKE84112.1 hypothetical protein HL663_09280 [Arthrobacter sp. NEB 688]